MRLVLLAVWSVTCAGVGAFLATHRTTPSQLAEKSPEKSERRPKQDRPVLEKLTEHAQDAVDTIKRTTLNDPAPKERHSEADRSAVDALIAKKGQR